MKHAMEMKDSPIKRILGISQPIHSSQWAYDRAMECGKALCVEMVVIDQSSVFDSLVCDLFCSHCLEEAGGREGGCGRERIRKWAASFLHGTYRRISSRSARQWATTCRSC